MQKIKREVNPNNKKEDISPTTTMMHRGTLGESNVFSRGKSMIEEPAKQEKQGAQKGKTPLELWQSNRTEDISC